MEDPFPYLETREAEQLKEKCEYNSVKIETIHSGYLGYKICSRGEGYVTVASSQTFRVIFGWGYEHEI